LSIRSENAGPADCADLVGPEPPALRGDARRGRHNHENHYNTHRPHRALEQLPPIGDLGLDRADGNAAVKRTETCAMS
jgi:hypothetical protein